MITQEADPLRFLKPRKKQFHLTPTKPIKYKIMTDNDTSFIQKKQIIQQYHKPSINIKQENNKYIPCSLYISLPYEAKSKLKQQQPNTSNPIKKIYNPSKYFSQKVERFLRNKQQIKQQPLEYSNKSQLSKCSTFQKNLSKDLIDYSIPLKNNCNKINQIQNQIVENTVRLSDYFQENTGLKLVENVKKTESKKDFNQNQNNNQSGQLNEVIAHYQQAKKVISTTSYKQPTKSKLNNEGKTQQKQSVDNKASNVEQNNAQQLQYSQALTRQLKQCPTCNRKFNLNSYQKHAKVCEKVFYKKRKQFSSEKQRSLSNRKR